MLKIFSKRMKKRIGIASLTFFLCSPLSYIHINWTEAASLPPPNQTEKQPPPKLNFKFSVNKSIHRKINATSNFNAIPSSPPRIVPPPPKTPPAPPPRIIPSRRTIEMSPPKYGYKQDKPTIWERLLVGMLFTRLSFARENAALAAETDAELEAIGFNCTGIDLEYPDKYVQVYCSNYSDSSSEHIDYYLDKTSLKVLNYNPPYYTIKVNEISTSTNRPKERKMNTWEFKYNINIHTVEFINIYGYYHHKYKNYTYLDPLIIEDDITAMAEMAFYMAYNMRFFYNQSESFYDVETL